MKIVLKKLKELGTIWHPETKLVFKSAKDKIVYGRYVDDELYALDDDAIQLCIKWRFKYDISDDSESAEEPEPVEETEPEPVEETEPEPVEETEPEPVEETEPEPVEETEPEPVEETEPEPVEETEPEPVEETEPEPVEETCKSENVVEERLDSIRRLSCSFSDSVIKSFNDIIKETDATNHRLEMELREKSDAYSELEKKFLELQRKFDGIKQLFSS